MQAAEESSPNKAQLGPWDVLDSFRLNHVHTEAAQFLYAATAQPLHFTLSFLRHGKIALKVRREPCRHTCAAQSKMPVIPSKVPFEAYF